MRGRLWLWVPLLLLAFGLRLYRLDYQYLWIDEGLSLYTAGLPLLHIPVFQGQKPFSHPPLYHLLLGFWIRGAGPTEGAARFFSLGFGLLLVPLLFRVGTRLGGERVGGFAALLAALSPFLTYYAQEARMYTLLGVLSLLSLYSTLRLLASEGERGQARWWLTYVLATLLSLYVHYYALFYFAALNLWALLSPALPQSRRRPWLLAQGAILALFLPWLGAALGLQRTLGVLAGRTGPGIEAAAILQEAALSFSLSDAFVGRSLSLAWLAAAFLALVLIGLVAFFRARQYQVALLVLGYLLLPLALALLIPWFIRPKYLFPSALAALVVAAYGLAWLRRLGWLPAILALGTLALVWGYVQVSEYQVGRQAKSSLAATLETVAQSASPGDAVLLSGAGAIPLFRYYYRGRVPSHFLPERDVVTLEQEEVERELSSLSQRYRGLWLVLYGAAELEDRVRRWLDDHAYRVSFRYYSDTTLSYYALEDKSPLQERETRVAFADVLRLEGYALDAETRAPGDVLRLSTRWRPLRAVREPLALSVRLRDASGQLQAQHDWWPAWHQEPAGTLRNKAGLPLPQDLAPGHYQVELVLYNGWTTQPYLPTTLENRSETGLYLGQVAVAGPG